jgi:PAS domain S-box-containing protein
MINQVFTIYSVFYLVTTLVSFFIAFLSWQRKSVKGAKELTSLMIASGLGAFCLIFETAAPSMPEKIFWAKLEYIGGVSTPVLYLIFVLRFTGRDKFLSLKHILLLFIIPFITLILTLTNGRHNLMWSGFSKISESTNLMEYYHGIWFWIGYITYTYILLFWSAILLIYFIFHQTKTFRSQGLVVFIAGLCPWIASMMYLNGNDPVPGLDLPPISLVLSGTLAAYAILNIRFLDLIPVARETLVETLSDGILVLDGQNRIQDINEAALSFLGIANKNIIGSSAVSSGASFMLLLDAAIDMESADQIEIPVNNETKTFRIIKKMIKNQPGSRLVVIRDITSTIHAEEALKESEIKYRKLVENSPDAIAIYVEGKIVFVNNECLRLMAAENPSELLGKSVLKFVHPDSHALVIERMKQTEAEGNVLPLAEEKFVRLNGSVVEVEVKAMSIRFGNKMAVQLIVRDITERKRAEEELKEKKERYRGLSEASFEAIFISENGICIEQNQAAEKMFGYTSEEAIGRHGTEWIAAEDREMIMKNMLSGYEEPYEATALKKDGTTFPCLIHGKMMHYKGKNVRVTSLNDITVRKRAENELIKAKEKAEESDRLKSAFLANMSHEIRTPMNSILGFTDLLKTQDLKREEQKEYIQIIQKGGDRLLNIINDIIDISKIESGQMEVTISKTNINDQIEYISSLFRPEVEGKRIQLITKNSLPGKEAILRTDREKIFAILTNLVKNAIKFTSEGFIELGYEKKERQLEFFVKDTGTGIPHKLQEIIFERFRQGNDSLNRNYEGTGLGLSISKAYVELLGGTIRVESEPGKGSVFYFTIPYNSETESKTFSTKGVSADAEERQIKRLKILIAEDDEASGILLAQAVKTFSKESLNARSGVEAVEVCRSNPDIDLVLMDIKMPEMDGYEAARQIRQFNKDVIIIAQTAFALTGDKEKALEAGCNDYISKPVNSRLLKELIQKYFKK